MSATATHFSMTATRVTTSSQRRISVAIRLLIWKGDKDGWMPPCGAQVQRFRPKEPTSLKCFVVLMMYGVFSFLSFFIQPCPKNSLWGEQTGRKKETAGLFLTSNSWKWCYSLIWNDFKHQMVQQSELFCNLQRGVALEGLGFPPHLPDTRGEHNTWFNVTAMTYPDSIRAPDNHWPVVLHLQGWSGCHHDLLELEFCRKATPTPEKKPKTFKAGIT